ncbi:hypothetical protein GUJ93_ZPchr0001g30547 [Zizania palustris]|uniref:Uncharacterized protein n=1 Tax=Zizania palustris TaxID=103762 RepID=A0A8J5VT03_ZIZPA|nr:hypothetical protein GUJ93_ZPchr0001g30547 [Zizania palustris]
MLLSSPCAACVGGAQGRWRRHRGYSDAGAAVRGGGACACEDYGGGAWAAAACVPARAAGTTHGLRLGAARVGPARAGAARGCSRGCKDGGTRGLRGWQRRGCSGGDAVGSARGLRGVDWRGQEGKYENTVELIESHGQTKR